MAETDPPPAPTDTPTSPQGSPTQWPPEDYRKWVQSEIASKMLLKFSGILSAVGIGTIILLVTSYLTLQEEFFDRQQSTIESNVEQIVIEQLKPQISGEIAGRLIDSSDLVDRAANTLRSRIGDILTEELQDPVNRGKIVDAVIEELGDDGDLQAIITRMALERAKDQDFNQTTRALALQMFALFHGGEGTAIGEQNLREEFALLAETATGSGSATGSKVLDPLPIRLIETILRYYPMGSRDDLQCVEDSLRCESQDDRVLAVILAHLTAGHGSFSTLRTDYTSFIRAISPRSVDPVRLWLRTNADHPAAPSIALAMLSSNDSKVLDRSVPVMIELVHSEDLLLRFLGLEALASMDDDAAISPGVRADALDALWAITPTSVLEAATEDVLFNYGIFPGDRRTSRDIAVLGDPAIDAMHRDWEKSFEEIPEQHEMLFHALVNLVRTSDQGGEWESIIRAKLIEYEPSVREARLRNSHAYRIWAARIERDNSLDREVSGAADRMLATETKDLLSSGHIQASIATAVRYASQNSLRELVDRYAVRWSEESTPETRTDVMTALLQRDSSSENPHELLQHLLDWSPPGQTPRWEANSLRGHVLSVALRRGKTSPIKFTNAELLREIAKQARSLVNSNDPAELSYCRILLHQLVEALSHHEMITTAEIENASLLPVYEPNAIIADEIGELQQRLHWIGDEVSDDHSVRFENGVPVTLDLPNGRPVRWYRASSDENLRYTVDSQPGLEIVFADTARLEYYRHFGNGDRAEPVVIPPGPFAIGLRRRTTSDSTVFAPRIKGESVPLRVFPTADGEPYQIALPYLVEIVSGDEPGLLNHRFSAKAGQVLHIETRGIEGSSPNLDDTVLELFDAEGRIPIARNDDYGDSYYSEIILEVEEDQEFLLRIYDYDDEDFASGLNFMLSISTLSPDTIIRGTTGIYDPHPVSFGQSLVELAEARAWLVYQPDLTQTLSIDSKLIVTVTEGSADGPLVYSNDWFEFEGEYESTFQVEAGNRYIISLNANTEEADLGLITINPSPDMRAAAEQ